LRHREGREVLSLPFSRRASTVYRVGCNLALYQARGAQQD